MKLDLELKQTQTLSPQMLQSISILQMGTLELGQYVEQLLLDNPLLEPTLPPPQEEGVRSDLLEQLKWLKNQDRQNIWYHQSDLDVEDPSFADRFGSREEETLVNHLRSQLRFDRMPDEMAHCVNAILECLSPNGYFDEDIHDFSLRLGFSPACTLLALEKIQALEPAGVGARNLSECLCLQLRRRGDADLAYIIARDYLPQVAEHRYAFIAKNTGATREAVGAACHQIRSLNPKPGAQFDKSPFVEYIVPELLVVPSEEGYVLAHEEPDTPPLQISGYYSLLQQGHDDKELDLYLEEKLRQARWVIQSIQQRGSTLRNCARCIVARQQSFFRNGPGTLRPMTLQDVAQEVSLHESTVSRAIRDKYLQCSHGVYPLSYFFTRSLGGEGEHPSSDQARTKLKLLIQQEDKKAPLSDQKLVALLEKAGIQISRRTVAKYRDELHIPGTSGRRQF